MKSLLFVQTAGLAFVFFSPSTTQAQGQPSFAAKVAPVVRKQLEINYPGDPGAVERMFRSWKAANGLQQVAEQGAAAALNAARTANSEGERQERSEELRKRLQSLRGVQTISAPIRNAAEGGLKFDPAGNPLPTVAPRSDGVAEEGGGNVARGSDGEIAQVFTNWSLDRMKSEHERQQALVSAEALRRIAEAASHYKNLEVDTEPGTFPGTEGEEMLQKLETEWEKIQQAESAGGEEPPPNIREILTRLARLRDRIQDHNNRLPSVGRTSAEVEPYNAEANELNREQDNLLNELNSATR